MYCPVSAEIRPAKYSRQSAPDAASATSVSCNGLPVSSDLEHGQLVVAFTDRLGGSVQHTPTLDGRSVRPGVEPAAGGLHRLFDDGRIGGAQAGDDRPVAGVDALELGPVTVDELAVDEVATNRLSAHRVNRSCRARHRVRGDERDMNGDFNSLGS